jgi:hypothetical protein
MDKLIHACETQIRIMSTGGTAREVSKEVCEHTYRQMEARRGNKPSGALEWKMYMRMMQRLDPSFG